MRPSRVREVRRASFVSRLHDYRVVSLPPRRRSVQVVPVYEMRGHGRSSDRIQTLPSPSLVTGIRDWSLPVQS